MIEAKVVAHSVNTWGNEIVTFVCTYHRYIHCELLTHRVFSRNAASSRAIPVEKMIARILAEPAMPVSWGKNQKGMQAEDILSHSEQGEAEAIWKESLVAAVDYANQLLDLGVHKQIANRLLEPFAHMTTIITATEWGNFFNLRVHKDAQPEFQALAYAMLEAYLDSKPVLKNPGEWHIPFGDRYLDEGLTLEQLLKIGTARCARVSYLNFEGAIQHEKDYSLHDQLLTSGHLSPFEHCARALDQPARVGNFRGWFQYRKQFPGENRSGFDAKAILAGRPS